MRPTRIVLHDVHLFLSDDIAAEVLLKFHRALQRHAKIPRLIVGTEEIFRRVDVIDVAPSATVEWLEKRWELDILEDLVPIHGIDQVAHRLIGRSWRVLLMGKDHSWG